MISVLKAWLKRFLSAKKRDDLFSHIDFAGIRFYSPAERDYNGLYRLLRDLVEGDSSTSQEARKAYFILQGDICAIADETRLFAGLALENLPCQDIIIDMSTEAINLGLHNQFYVENLQKLSDILAKDKYKGLRFSLIHANTAHSNDFQRKLDEVGLAKCNYNFDALDFYLGRFFLDLKSADLFRRFDKVVLKKQTNIQKHFICLNHRPRWQRYAVVLHLLAQNHLEKGYVSFAGETQGRVDAPTVEDLSDITAQLRELDSGDALVEQISTLTQMTPLVLDREPEEIQNQLWGKEQTGTIDQPLGFSVHAEGVECDVNACYFEIVTETYFTDERCSYITEKTLRPILFMRPFIHVGTPFMLEKLRRLGFKTFSPWFNEDYDSVKDPAKRMDLILSEIDRLCQMSLTELSGMNVNLQSILRHNKEHFEKHGKALLENEMKQLSLRVA